MAWGIFQGHIPGAGARGGSNGFRAPQRSKQLQNSCALSFQAKRLQQAAPLPRARGGGTEALHSKPHRSLAWPGPAPLSQAMPPDGCPWRKGCWRPPAR